jgi:uncharacterized membrane protein
VPACSGEPKVDPQTGLIRVLFMGDSEMEPNKVAPTMIQDPMLDLTRIPVEALTWSGDIEVVARGLRMYFPRVARQVYEEYDVLIIADAREPFFPLKIQNWFKEAVIEHGVGFLMAGGPQSFGGYEPWGHPTWDGSPVADVLPVVCLREWQYSNSAYHLVPVQQYQDHPLVRNIPWKQVALRDYNRVQQKPGAIVVGESDNYPPGSPILTYIELGKGIGEAFVFDWGGGSIREFDVWPYAPVALSNMLYWIARVSIPEEMGIYLRVRNLFAKYLSLRSYALSVMDFAEKFGANMDKAGKALLDSDTDRKQVVALYVNGGYEESLEKLESALENLNKVSQLALKAKDEALLWVYVVEWFTVSGTAMLAGVVLWTLMIRRSAYREVRTTRFAGR